MQPDPRPPLQPLQPPQSQVTAPVARPGLLHGYLPGVLAAALPVAAFALAWLIAGKIPFAVPTREWGTWFVIGPLLGITGIVGMVFTCQAFMRRRLRAFAIAGLVINPLLMLIAWAGLFG